MPNFFTINQDSVNLLFLVVGVVFSGILFYAGVISIYEKEYRAVKASFLFSMLLCIPFLTVYFIDFPYRQVVEVVLLSLIILSLLILFIPYNFRLKGVNQTPTEKHDERDIMFSRNELSPGTEKFEAYYRKNPGKKLPDSKFREKPGLLSPKALLYNPYHFASANANLEIIEALKPKVSGAISENKMGVNPQKLTDYLKTWSRKLGAHSMGVTELKDYHLYTNKGRGELYGNEIKNQHKYAIAITIEMGHEMIQTAPKGPVVMESTQQYLNSGTIALQIAYFIRNLGYPARAHIDGNYELVCPLVARDAGLGEIGRMGLLMTPKLGPRVRIAVVTTDIPLIADNKNYSPSVIDFCETCKKCADVCPSSSIPFGKRENINGALRWKINSESCFTYWCSVGTDCGRCMAACPYSHPNNFMHNVVRRGINNSHIFRRFALFMDDLFYGRKPKPGIAPF